MATLGQTLPELYLELLNLLLVLKDEEKRPVVRGLMLQLKELMQPAIDTAISQADANYAAAVQGLEAANKVIKETIADVKKVDEAIKSLASGLSLLAKLLKVVL